MPNLYPAFDRQEVVVHSPRHVRTFAELSDDEVAAVAQAWTARTEAVPGYMHACINEGRAAGSSLPHSHSQLVWLDGPPPEVSREQGRQPQLVDDLVVAERGGEVITRLRAVEGAAPWNAWLHPRHLEIVPRLTVLAGVELGAGIYVNTVAPEDAAAALRGAAS